MAGDCGTACPVESGFYAYDPSIGGNAVLLAAYALLIPAVLYPGFRFSTLTFSIILVIGLILDVVGFVGRILLHGAPDRQDFFIVSLLGTVLGPTFITGAMVLTLPHTLSLCGERVSPLRRLLASISLFISTAGAAVLQLVGIVYVSYNFGDVGRAGGAELIAGGLRLQAIALLGFIGLHFWFIIKANARRPVVDAKHSAMCRSSRFRRFLFGTGAASVLLFTYSIYRIAEMVDGLDGGLFQSQVVFMILNGAMPLVAAALLTIVPPGPAFGSRWTSVSPLRLRKTRIVPPPLKSPREQMEEKAHHRYDPDIRKQFSPGSQRALRLSNPPEMPEGSPGLPSNPKPVHKTTSPLPSPTATVGTAKPAQKNPSPMPSPTWTARTAETNNNRQSIRSDSKQPKQMVEKDSLW